MNIGITERGYSDMEKTLKTGEIGKLAAESRFTYGGMEWVVLEHNLLKKAVLVLAADVLKKIGRAHV